MLTAPPDRGPTGADHGSELSVSESIAAGETPQAIVPAGYWQQAAPATGTADGYTLVGCTVAPAFLFERFEMAPDGFALAWE